jgi:hypothetical protein
MIYICDMDKGAGIRLNLPKEVNESLKVRAKELGQGLKILGKAREAAAVYLLEKILVNDNEEKIDLLNSFMEKHNIKEFSTLEGILMKL